MTSTAQKDIRGTVAAVSRFLMVNRRVGPAPWTSTIALSARCGGYDVEEGDSMNADDIKAVAALEVNRRKLLQGLGVAAGATALGLSPSDPVYAATVGYDLKHGADRDPYMPPRC